MLPSLPVLTLLCILCVPVLPLRTPWYKKVLATRQNQLLTSTQPVLKPSDKSLRNIKIDPGLLSSLPERFDRYSPQYSKCAMSVYAFLLSTDKQKRLTIAQLKAVNALVPLAYSNRELLDLNFVVSRWESIETILKDVDFKKLVTKRPKLILSKDANLVMGIEKLTSIFGGFDGKTFTSVLTIFPRMLSSPGAFDFDAFAYKVDNLTSILFDGDIGSLNKLATARIATSLLNQNPAGLSIAGNSLKEASFTSTYFQRNPRLLTQDPRVTIERRRQLGLMLPGVDVPKMLLQKPRLLSIDVEKKVPEVLATLRRCLPKDVDVDMLIRRNPSLLVLKGTDLTLSRRLESLASLLSFEDKLALRSLQQRAENVPESEQDIADMKKRGKIAASSLAPVLTRNPHLLYSVDTKKKLAQLSKVLNISVLQAKRIANRSPTILSMDIEVNLKKKLTRLASIFRCSKKEVVRIVLRAPGLLCLKSETIGWKLKQLELVLSGIDQSYMEGDVKGSVTSSTLAIAKRVPSLLTQDIGITIQRRSVSLRYLLMGGDSIGRNFMEEESQVFEKVLRRAPELLLLDIEKTVAPKLLLLSSLVRFFQVFERNDESKEGAIIVGSSEVGARLAIKEPRLLLWDVKTLKIKYDSWRERVKEGAALDGVLARYPTLLMYSFGACARLEYYRFWNGDACDALEARKLIMLSKQKLERWGEEEKPPEDSFSDDTEDSPDLPLFLRLGGNLNLGRPRVGESSDEMKRRNSRSEENRARVEYETLCSYKVYLAALLTAPFVGGGKRFPKITNEARLIASRLSVADMERLYGNIIQLEQISRNVRDELEEEEGDRTLAEKFFASPGIFNDALGISLVERARRDEKLLRYKFADDILGEKLASLVPTLDIRALVSTQPAMVAMMIQDFDAVVRRVENLRRLLKGVDIGKIVSKEPEILVQEDFAMMQNRFARLLDTLGYYCTYSALTKVVEREPRLILPVSDTERVVEKLKYVIEAVGVTQEEKLVNLIMKAPDLLFTAKGGLCRLEYLSDCGGAGNQEKEVRVRGLYTDDDELCSVAGGVLTPPLLVGQIPAVLFRGVGPMIARHPFYDIYVLEKVLQTRGVISLGEKENYMQMQVEQLEDMWAEVLLKAE